MKKTLSIIGKILLGLLGFVLIAVLGFKAWDWIRHFDFYKNAKPFYDTPGVNEGYVPQGFDYVEEDDVYLSTGYMSNDSASRVYVMYPDGSTTYTQLLDKDGKPYTGHTGGIERNGDYVYITGAAALDVFSYADILKGEKTTPLLGNVATYNDPAYCYIHNGYVLTGSFFDEGTQYETPEHERVTTPKGDKNTSIITVFKLDDSFEFGIDPTPKAVISTRDCVQGMCITPNGKVILSTSYGLSTSQLFIYDTTELTGEDYHFTGTTKQGESFDHGTVKRYYLDSAVLIETLETPPMSEEILYRDGKILIMNESACNKYFFGKITSGLKLYALPYDD